jgi:hypothetical protein
MQELHSAPLPLSNGYGPCGILAVCHINLWSAVRTELGQKDWVKQLVAMARGPMWPVIRVQVGVTTVAR